tara:strand:+ start:375 stop:521 length:147 start_codon:yes stop_codon:yes gene_type:complete
MKDGIGKIEFGKKKEANAFTYFLAFGFWLPLIVTVFRFWWDFFSWLVQ